MPDLRNSNNEKARPKLFWDDSAMVKLVTSRGKEREREQGKEF